ncbi:MAG: LysR family transcriptional regulator [Plesiomonas sp.]|uniref:LysR family transcriptional regulator n=1 Tax=Plesiomonas sp. TaxID=2486279 RepID=UPI003F2D71BD
MRFKLDDMMLFIRVAEKLSFSRVAEELDIPQPTVSRRIRYFEDQLRQRLFERTTRQIQLTEIGQGVLKHCYSVLDEIKELENFIDESHQDVCGELVIASSARVGSQLANFFLSSFLDAYPHVSIVHKHIQMQEGYGDFDGDILLSQHKPSNGNLIAQRMSTGRRSFYASPAYIEKFGLPKSPEEFIHHKFVMFDDGFLPPDTIKYSLSDGTIREQKVCGTLTFSNVENAYGMALQGHGIIWSPFILACKDVELGNIIPLFDGQFGLDLPFYAIYRSRRNQPAKIRCFIEMLKTSFEQINQDNYSKFAYPYTLSDIDERR